MLIVDTKKRIRIILSLAAFLLLAILLWKLDIRHILSVLNDADLFFLFLSFSIMGLFYLVWNYKWFVLTRRLESRVAYWTLLPMLFASNFVNVSAPGGGFGGEPLRASLLAKKYGKKRTLYFAANIVDKSVNTFVFLVLLLPSLFFVLFFMTISSPVKHLIGFFILLVIVLVVGGVVVRRKIDHTLLPRLLRAIYFFKLFSFMRKRFRTFSSFENFFVQRLHLFVTTFSSLVSKKQVIFGDLFLGVVQWLVRYLVLYFVFVALHFPISLLFVICAVNVSYFVSMVSFIPGGFGVYETIMIGLYASFGIPAVIAASATLVERFIYYFYGLIIGYLCLVGVERS